MKQIIEKPTWLPLSAHLPILSPPPTAKQRVVIIPDQPEEGIDGYGEKDLEKGSFKTFLHGYSATLAAKLFIKLELRVE